MPEGDSIYRTARRLHDALAGERIVRFQSMFPALNRIDEDRPLAGRSIESVTSRGKHLLMTFSGDLILHTHLRMNGAWKLYRAGEAWRRPARDMRIRIDTDGQVAVAFSIPVAEFLTARQLARHDRLNQIGPDPLDPNFDAAEAARRLRGRGHEPVGEALLNQRVVSGLGNVLKSEALFVARANPFDPLDNFTDHEIDEIILASRRVITTSVLEPHQSLSPGLGRRTMTSLDPSARLWVYGRTGQRCRTCGEPIRSRKTGVDARVTYWCPRCQPARTA
jgi:endonuclease-8